METIKTAEGHQTVIPYLILTGAEPCINFLKKVFHAEEKFRVPRPEDENMIMHAEVKIGDATLMIAEATETYQPMTAGMYIYVEDTDKAYQLALAEGATSVYEPRDESYGVRAAGVKDPFGNTWWLASLL